MRGLHVNTPFLGSNKRRVLALMTVAALVAAGCGRDEDDQAADDEDAEETSSDASEETAGGGNIAGGEFGDLGPICQDGDASGSDETGLSDDEIVVGTVTDKGSDIRAGLTREMYDTAVAFTEWCNDNGGINGRQLRLEDMDAKLTEYNDRITDACDTVFAMVGGGAVFDADDNGARAECGLVNIAGYVVTPEARASEQQVQPLPNPAHQFSAQRYKRIREIDPDIERFGMLWVDFAGPKTIADQVRETVEAEGYEMTVDQPVAPVGETGWANYVREMKEQDVQVVEYIGEPEDQARLLEAMDVEGWYPEYMLGQPNMYDELLIDEAGPVLGEGLIVRSAFPPLDVNGEVPAISDYRELMETYNNEGKWPALLGMQGLSSWLLFATAAVECGDDLSRECVLENAFAVDEWTAGGLHGPTDPGNLQVGACGVLLRVTEDGVVYDEELTNPDSGDYFNCEESNVNELSSDYGVEAPAR